jgi:TPR repeat protein
MLIGHNVDFDIGVIQAELRRAGIAFDMEALPFICTMKTTTNIARIPHANGRGYKWPTLQELHTALFGSNFRGAHTSKADVEATLKCYLELRKRGHYPSIAHSSFPPRQRQHAPAYDRAGPHIAPSKVQQKYRTEAIQVGTAERTSQRSAEERYDRGVQVASAGDYATAVGLWRQAAEQGHAKAQYNLGVAYARGLGVAEDMATARDWWRRAGEKGHTRATAELLKSTRFGSGGQPSSFLRPSLIAVAMAWLKKALNWRSG